MRSSIVRRALVSFGVAVVAVIVARRIRRKPTPVVERPDDRALPGFKPSPLLLTLFRAPVWLYRLGFGWLLGHRALLLVHRGRTSGRRYATVLEVVHYDPATRESVVVSGLGTRADWYRNVVAGQAVEVRTARERYQPAFRELPDSEHFAIIEAYVRKTLSLARPIIRKLGFDVAGTIEERRAHAARLLFIGFRPASDSQPSNDAELPTD